MLPAHLSPLDRQPALQSTEAARRVMFDQMWTRLRADPLLDELNAAACGAEYPYDVTVFGSCTRTILDLALAGLNLAAGDTLVDLGCGLGGPGRWLARESGANVTGVDLSQVAVDGARAAAVGYLRPGQYEYRLGTITATGLPDRSADGLVSIDALPMAADRAAALSEVRRVLRPGGRAVFTCAEWHGDQPLPHPRMATRWAPLIADAALVLVDQFIDRGKQDRQLRKYKLWLEHETDLVERFGPTGLGLLEEARKAPGLLTPNFRALLLTIQRPAA
ncbi:MAG: class I SAM-dependent methyltransferase [Actinomycetota bacterium]|nr:class I SAM-dependent methyltransferase [Actinomycetota bacterium]